MYAMCETNVEVMDHKDGEKETCEQIAAANRSGCYSAIVISDLSAEAQFPKFTTLIGPALLEYVGKGGRVAFPTSEGIMLLDVLKELFGVVGNGSGTGELTSASRMAAQLL